MSVGHHACRRWRTPRARAAPSPLGDHFAVGSSWRRAVAERGEEPPVAQSRRRLGSGRRSGRLNPFRAAAGTVRRQSVTIAPGSLSDLPSAQRDLQAVHRLPRWKGFRAWRRGRSWLPLLRAPLRRGRARSLRRVKMSWLPPVFPAHVRNAEFLDWFRRGQPFMAVLSRRHAAVRVMREKGDGNATRWAISAPSSPKRGMHYALPWGIRRTVVA